MPQNRLFLIEFNELCPSLLSEFMEQGILPNFSDFYGSSQVFTTDAAEQHPNLEPWIQWVSVHSGMTFSEHKVFHLGDGRSMKQKCVAELLSEAGLRTGVFGSMNLNYERLSCYYLPDPWDKIGHPHPESITPYYEVTSRQVQESSTNSSLSLADVGRFGLFLIKSGLTVSTALSVAAQLASEIGHKSLRWKRAMLLDQINYDVFNHLNQSTNVQFATFFSNSTAHFQHYYWRDMAPEGFDVPPPEENEESFRTAIQDGYRAMDRLLGRFMRDYSDALLVFCTALSQQPWTETTKYTFRPRNFNRFLQIVGIDSSYVQVKPVMAEQFHLICRDVPSAVRAESQLRNFSVDGKPLMMARREGESVFAGCACNHDSAMKAVVVNNRDGARFPFADLFHPVGTMRSGRHHPDGALWFRTGQHHVSTEKVPLTSIAPTILQYFNVKSPAYMNGPVLPILGLGSHIVDEQFAAHSV